MLRESGSFWTILDNLRQSQWFSEPELHEYQQERLAALVRHAAKEVPYYRSGFTEWNLDPEQFHDLDHLSRIPLLSKRDVVRAGRSLVAGRRWTPTFEGTTSGSTGLTLTGFRDLTSIRSENAFLWRQLEWAGWHPGDRSAWLRGDFVVPLNQKRPPYWRVNRADDVLMLSSFHLSEETADAYLDALRQYDPVIIQAYPSSIAYLGRYLASRGKYYRGDRLKGVITSSETLLEDQRKVIDQRFGCRVFDWYGQYERVAAIGTCEKGSYHVVSDYGFTQFLPCTDGTAEIVGTGFFNFAMPLIRYRTGDNVVLAKSGTRCSCGRSFPIVERVVGRIDDYVKTPDGRRIGMFAIIFEGLQHIWEVQAIQEALDEIRILVVPMPQFSVEDERELVSRAKELVGPEMRIRIERVLEIKRTERGKIRTVICRV